MKTWLCMSCNEHISSMEWAVPGKVSWAPEDVTYPRVIAMWMVRDVTLFCHSRFWHQTVSYVATWVTDFHFLQQGMYHDSVNNWGNYVRRGDFIDVCQEMSHIGWLILSRNYAEHQPHWPKYWPMHDLQIEKTSLHDRVPENSSSNNGCQMTCFVDQTALCLVKIKFTYFPSLSCWRSVMRLW